MTLIATTDIFVSRGVRAFRAGDVVPDSVVENLDVRHLVVGEKAKAAIAVRPPVPETPKDK